MVTFNDLPAEIRLNIYEALFPSDGFQSLKPLGFRNPNLEQAPPNVSITVPTSVLVDFYKSNPAGESKGRFWRPIPLLAVNRQIREEASYVYSKILVEVGTWMSFLSRRPDSLLSQIQHVHFTYWLNPKWTPQHPPDHPHYALDGWVNSITGLWGEQLERLYCIMGANLHKMSIDMTLLWPPMVTYRVNKGLCKESLASVMEKMPGTLERVLLGFREAGKWPETEVIVGWEEDTNDAEGIVALNVPEVAASA